MGAAGPGPAKPGPARQAGWSHRGIHISTHQSTWLAHGLMDGRGSSSLLLPILVGLGVSQRPQQQATAWQKNNGRLQDAPGKTSGTIGWGCLVWSTRSMPSLVLRTGLGAAGCQPSSPPSANFCPCRREISDNRRLVRRQDLSGRAVAAAARPALRCPASWCGMSREISHVLVFLCVAHVPCGGGGRRGSGAVSGRFSHKGCEGGGVVESPPERFVSCS